MTVAAQLMAAGADQQLIAAKLQESHEIGVGAKPSSNNYTQALGQLSGSESPKLVKDGLVISHDEVIPPVEPVIVLPMPEPTPEPIVTSVIEPVEPSPAYAADVPAPVTPPELGKIADAYALDPLETTPSVPSTPATAPLLGGIPAAPTIVPQPLVTDAAPVSSLTTPLAAQPEIVPVTLALESATQPSQEISKHSYLSDTPDYNTPINSNEGNATTGSTDIFANLTPQSASGTPADSLGGLTDTSRDQASRDDALAQVSAAYDQPAVPQLFSPVPGITLPPPPPLPDFGALPTPVAPAYVVDTSVQQPERLGDILAPSPVPAASDPGQFQIPNQ
jgi:hypothetical protein